MKYLVQAVFHVTKLTREYICLKFWMLSELTATRPGSVPKVRWVFNLSQQAGLTTSGIQYPFWNKQSTGIALAHPVLPKIWKKPLLFHWSLQFREVLENGGIALNKRTSCWGKPPSKLGLHLTGAWAFGKFLLFIGKVWLKWCSQICKHTTSGWPLRLF